MHFSFSNLLLATAFSTSAIALSILYMGRPPTLPSASPPPPGEATTDVLKVFEEWDSRIGCAEFRKKHGNGTVDGGNGSLQKEEIRCDELKLNHVNLLVKGWTWIPDEMENLYRCRCGLTCLWTKSDALADKPDALLFEHVPPPRQRKTGDPLRISLDLEAGRQRFGYEDLFVGFHAADDVQATYAATAFRKIRSYHSSHTKNNETLVYWSSSRCVPHRDELAKKILTLLPHHSFGWCLNNVGGFDTALSMYPDCIPRDDNALRRHWWDHLHCAMSHYKFVLAVENTFTESYVTEKLFYALDSGSVPIYFGAPNVEDFVPPHSVIVGSKFRSVEELAAYVKAVGNDPVKYGEYHAWRRCGVVGNYGIARAASLDTLPCRLCEAVSRRNGRQAPPPPK